MHKYIVRRLIMLIPVIIGVTFIVYSIMFFTPGDPALIILGENAPEEQVEKLREEMGLNDHFIIQYLRFLKNALKGDFGRSYSTRKPVFDEIFSRFPATLKLSTAGLLIAVAIGIPVGIISATKQYSAIDSITMILALLGVSMPNFWLGLMLILLFSVNLGLLPSGGDAGFSSLILPAITLGTGVAAIITRMTRSSMLEVIRQDYIRTARAKGVAERKVINKHALKNALIPVVTVIGLQFGYLLGGAVLTETVFSWPGVGRLMVEAIKQKDTPVVLASVIFMSVVFSIVNLLVDILYAFLDPRIKSQYR
ncbi:nickel ABC transporter permease [Tepidimicrobium xylanilyticum]|uniref:Nickel import system permease protein NikB n=1 Tax=Tepidimicrobium xylanilyticum TaxID=1123352 RepID=A0A1H2VF46_9FIRM|nr:nickel ABC transporter permease [Tepidimicrobium xylanilyticum]GMG96652.1 peptide ABC transporter permease [Tepidimicrobium xylanilyticum]SDW66966.1 peptide/nickel transport system permease protein [Tepidimicrobium xylanilyticum]